MPSLQQAFSSLAQQSDQIAYLSTLNISIDGPFTSAVLHLQPPDAPHLPRGNVLDLIRDANPSEQKLFKFIGESDGPKGKKRAEKRETEIVTPLKDLKQRGEESKDKIGVLLQSALKVIDDCGPRPRARAHVQHLLNQHLRNQERLAELDMHIAEASNPTQRSSSPTPQSRETPGPSADQYQPTLSPEESIKAEEAALRALEARLGPLRQAAATSHDVPGTPLAPPPGRNIPSSPLSSEPVPPTPLSRSIGQSQTRTPGKNLPNIANFLVTPRNQAERVRQNAEKSERIDRFSPLKNITPRPTPADGLGRSIFRRGLGGLRGSVLGKSVGIEAATSAPAPAPSQPLPEDTTLAAPQPDTEGDDETLMLSDPPLSPSPELAATPETHPTTPPKIPGTPEELTPRVVEVHPPPETGVLSSHLQAETESQVEGGDGKVEGVTADCNAVKAGVGKVWAAMSDLMRQGLPDDGSFAQDDISSSIKHLARLSNAELPPPPSPSTSSSISSLGKQPPAKPITSETVLFAHLFLAILQACAPDGSPGVDMKEVKDRLTGVATARGFSGAAGLATKVIYAAVGKRVVAIDRKGGGLGRIKFQDS